MLPIRVLIDRINELDSLAGEGPAKITLQKLRGVHNWESCGLHGDTSVKGLGDKPPALEPTPVWKEVSSGVAGLRPVDGTATFSENGRVRIDDSGISILPPPPTTRRPEPIPKGARDRTVTQGVQGRAARRAARELEYLNRKSYQLRGQASYYRAEARDLQRRHDVPSRSRAGNYLKTAGRLAGIASGMEERADGISVPGRDLYTDPPPPRPGRRALPAPRGFRIEGERLVSFAKIKERPPCTLTTNCKGGLGHSGSCDQFRADCPECGSIIGTRHAELCGERFRRMNPSDRRHRVKKLTPEQVEVLHRKGVL